MRRKIHCKRQNHAGEHVQQGNSERQVERRSFAELAEDWYSTEIEGQVKHPKIARRYLDNHLLPRLRHKKADEITTTDITGIVDGIKKEAPTAANDLLRYSRRIFDFGVRRRRVPMNPAAGLVPKRDGGGTERPRQRSLRFDELVAFFKSMRDTPAFGQVNELTAKLLLALLVRKMQLIGAKRSEFDLDGKTNQGPVWRLPASKAKTDKIALDIPLVPQVVAWLRRLEVLAGNDEYLFPRLRHDRRQRFPHMGVDTLNVALSTLDHNLEHFTVHDLRRTARTHLAELGVLREVAERCLAHKIKGVEGTYDTHSYFKERRQALEQWTEILCAAEKGKSRGKVSPRKRVS